MPDWDLDIRTQQNQPKSTNNDVEDYGFVICFRNPARQTFVVRGKNVILIFRLLSQLIGEKNLLVIGVYILYLSHHVT